MSDSAGKPPAAAGLSVGFDEIRRSDVVIVGTGAAGLSAVEALQGRSVTVLSKGKIGRDGSSHYAQGGIAAALRSDDSPEAHARDTERVGVGLSDPENTRILTEEGPGRLLDVLSAGAEFDRGPDGEFTYGLEAGHGVARIIHAKDATGAELMRALVETVNRQEGLIRQEETFAYDLAVQAGRVIGVLALDRDRRRVLHLAPAVILATGGFGQLYPDTTNPPTATGDGIAMAARAGAEFADLEFVQFHPTALGVSQNPRPLLTEALRGAGATLWDGAGDRFMIELHPDAELAPRDVVARAVWERVQDGRGVFLDAREIFATSPERFPTVGRLAAEHGIDPATEQLPVVPAAHYAMGGIRVDSLGRTSLEGLWACGESACTGVHGANRLASNSLLEALVFGRRTGLDIDQQLEAGLTAPSALVGVSEGRALHIDPRPLEEITGIEEVRSAAFDGLGIERGAASLEKARDFFQKELHSSRHQRSERASLLTVGYLIAEAALARQESRGAHSRSDFPEANPALDRRSHQRFSHELGRISATPAHTITRTDEDQATRRSKP